MAMLLALPARTGLAATPPVVVQRAPIVWLHSTEKFWPLDPTAFVARSSLGWHRRRDCRDTLLAKPGAVNPMRLGIWSVFRGGPYEEHPTAVQQSGSGACAPRAGVRLATDFTRPEHGNDEGFFLNHDNDLRGGAPPRCPQSRPRCGAYDEAPVLYQYAPRRFITYWFFFAFSAPFRGGSLSQLIGHEGDWERISIRLGRSDEPLAVAYWQHHGEPSDENGRIVSWAALEGEHGVVDGHPVVFSARGSHASYPKACRELLGLKTCVADRRDRGWMWRSQADLRDVTRELWYGFGGAWGTIRGGGADFTGPSGPGPNGLGCHKPAAPKKWLPAGTCG